MIFRETRLAGAWLVELEPHADERGHFARAWCREEFAARGLDPEIAQVNVSRSERRGTLRGMHYQAAPWEEAKLVRCTAGALWDVVLDLRAGSATRGRWFGVELGAGGGTAVYVPRGCAHGFVTLADRTEVTYLVSTPHHPEAARGVRFDDPAFAIRWPEPVRVISEKDRSWPWVD